MVHKCSNPQPPSDWLIQHPFTMPTDEDREKAKYLLSNTAHYRHGCINEADDIDTIARGLAMERRLAEVRANG